MVEFIGIDYGSKIAGTTAIAHWVEGQIRVEQSQRKQDADAWIQQWLELHPEVERVYIDAPLSLPLVYAFPEEGHRDYFYRQADRAVQAMSPLFLGGLTARAMQLRQQCVPRIFTEVYPGYLARSFQLQTFGYKSSSQAIHLFLEHLEPLLPYPPDRSTVQSWHAVDAILAWWSGHRQQHQAAMVFGEPREGLIIV